MQLQNCIILSAYFFVLKYLTSKIETDVLNLFNPKACLPQNHDATKTNTDLKTVYLNINFYSPTNVHAKVRLYILFPGRTKITDFRKN